MFEYTERPARYLRAILRDRYVADVAIAVVIYAIVRFLLFAPTFIGRALELSEAAYSGPSMFLGALSNPAFLVLAGSGLIAMWLHYIPGIRNPFYGSVSWDSQPESTRVVLMAFCLPMVWKLATYDVNLVFGQLHGLDRVLIVAFWFGIGRTPAFAPIWLALAGVMTEQFNYPAVLSPSWADKGFELYVPLLFWVTFIVGRLRRSSSWLFPTLLLCHVASSYVCPAYAKMALGPAPWSWMAENDLGNLLVASWHNGWLPALSESQVARAAGLLSLADPMKALTMLVELAPLFILIHRRATIGMLIAAVALHLGIFATTGIFFWEWILPELVLVWVLVGPWSRAPVADMFRSPHRWLSVILIAAAFPVFWPYWLGWYDSPYGVAYDVEVELESGERFMLERNYMAPHESRHTQSRLNFLDPVPRFPVGSYSSTGDAELFILLDGVESASDLDAQRENLIVSRYDGTKVIEYEEYLLTFFTRLNQLEGRKHVVPRWLRAPEHQMSPRGDVPPPGEWSDVVRVRVHSSERFFTGTEVLHLDDGVCLEVTIPAR